MFPGTLYATPPVVYAPAVGTDPDVEPLPSNVMTYEATDHCACNVADADTAYDAAAAYAVPDPSATVFHPLNVYPALTRLPVFPATVYDAPPGVYEPLAGTDPPVDPFAAKLMAYVPTAVHCAYNVAADDVEYDAPTAYAVPVPSAVVFQPANVYPVRTSVPVFAAAGYPAPPEVYDPELGTDPPVEVFAS